MTASHLSRCVEIYFESNVQLARRTGFIFSRFLGQRRRAKSERHARRRNASPVARVSCLAFLTRIAHVSCLAFLARLRSSEKRVKTTYNGQMWPGKLGSISFDTVSSKYTAKTLPPSSKLGLEPCNKKIPGFLPADCPT